MNKSLIEQLKALKDDTTSERFNAAIDRLIASYSESQIIGESLIERIETLPSVHASGLVSKQDVLAIVRKHTHEGREMDEENLIKLIADSLEATTPLKYECWTNYMVAATHVLRALQSIATITPRQCENPPIRERYDMADDALSLIGTTISKRE